MSSELGASNNGPFYPHETGALPDLTSQSNSGKIQSKKGTTKQAEARTEKVSAEGTKCLSTPPSSPRSAQKKISATSLEKDSNLNDTVEKAKNAVKSVNVTNQISPHKQLGTPEKLPLITDLKQIFGNSQEDIDPTLANAIRTSSTPGKQILSWELVAKHAKEIQTTTDLSTIGYEKNPILIGGIQYECFLGNQPLIVHSTSRQNILRIIEDAPEPGHTSENPDFWLNEMTKICASHYEPGQPIYKDKSWMQCILKVSPKAIVDIAPEDISSPMKDISKETEAYLRFREKMNAATLYLNEIFRQCHAMLDREKAPQDTAIAHMVGLTDHGFFGEMSTLIARYQDIPLEQQKAHAQALFGKGIDKPIVEILKELQSSIQGAIDSVINQAPRSGRELAQNNNKIYPFRQIAHPSGPSELSKSNNYSELNILTTKNQKNHEEPFIEVVAIGIPECQLNPGVGVWRQYGTESEPTLTDMGTALKAAIAKNIPIIILKTEPEEIY